MESIQPYFEKVKPYLDQVQPYIERAKPHFDEGLEFSKVKIAKAHILYKSSVEPILEENYIKLTDFVTQNYGPDVTQKFPSFENLIFTICIGLCVTFLFLGYRIFCSCCCSRRNTKSSSGSGKSKNKSNKNSKTTTASSLIQPRMSPSVGPTNAKKAIIPVPGVPGSEVAPRSDTNVEDQENEEIQLLQNNTAKAIIKAKRQEIERLNKLKKSNDLNNRQRRAQKKLEKEVQILLAAEVDKNGYVINKLLLSRKTNGAVKQGSESDDESNQGDRVENTNSTKDSSESHEAKLIDLQREYGLSMEQASAAAIAMQLNNETSEEVSTDPFRPVVGAKGGKKAKKAQEKKEEIDGWAVVGKKK